MVSFDLSSEPGSGIPYEYHAHVVVPVYYAEPVQVEVAAKNSDANRGTTELAVELVDKANAKLSAIYVNGEKTPVSSDGVASITNRTTGNNPVRVSVKNEDLSSGYYIKETDGYTDLPLSVGITPAVPFSVTFEENGDPGKRGTTALKLTAVFSAIGASNYSISVDKTPVASAVGTEVTIENWSANRKKPEVKVVLAENEATNGYADFTGEVGITPAVPFSVTFEENGDPGKRGTTALKLTSVFSAIGASNYSISVDETPVASAVGTEVTIENRSANRKKLEVKVVLAENEATNGYADFTGEVGITPAVHAVTFAKSNGEKDKVGTTEITATNHVDKAISVFIDESTTSTTIPPGGTIVPVTNSNVTKETVSIVVDKTDETNNGYYIQPAEKVVIVPAVKIERRSFYSGAELFDRYLNAQGSDKYDYLFTTKGGLYYPASFVATGNVAVKDKDGNEIGTVDEFKSYTDWNDNAIRGTKFEDLAKTLSDIKEVYKITFTLNSGKTTDDAILVVPDDKQPNGYYIPAVSVNP